MVDAETVRWTLSSLLQGICALYGLVLIFYTYFRSKTESYIWDLVNEKEHLLAEVDKLWIAGDTLEVEERLFRVGAIYEQILSMREEEKPVFQWLSQASAGFVIVIFLDVLGLQLYSNYYLYLLALAGSSFYLALLAGTFSGYAQKAIKRTTARREVEKGAEFFGKTFEQHMEGPIQNPRHKKLFEDWQARYRQFRTKEK